MACEQVYCQSSSNQLPGIKVVQYPTGDGGTALNENFRTLQYRQPKCNYEATGDPGKDNASNENYCIGSRWLNTANNKMWICVNNSYDEVKKGSAVWVPWFRWDETCGDKDKSLAVDTNFAVDGEIRRIDKDHKKKNLPLVLVPLGKGTNSALILGNHCARHGGDPRGISAVDFQTKRKKNSEVAFGTYSFIAGGQSNTAFGKASHAEGQGTMAIGRASHSEGYVYRPGEMSASGRGEISASGRGAHAEGYAKNVGKIRAIGYGAHAGGMTTGRTIKDDFDAELKAKMMGQVPVVGSIVAGSGGARAFGRTRKNAQIIAIGEGAFAHGSADGARLAPGTIRASGPGAHASGIANKGSVYAIGKGSHAMGGDVRAEKDYSFCFGQHLKAIEKRSFVLGFGEKGIKPGFGDSYLLKNKIPNSLVLGVTQTAALHIIRDTPLQSRVIQSIVWHKGVGSKPSGKELWKRSLQFYLKDLTELKVIVKDAVGKVMTGTVATLS